MRSFDPSLLWRSTVGFDHLFDLIDASMRSAGQDTYPPYNIERIGDDKYQITLALAGFSAEELVIKAGRRWRARRAASGGVEIKQPARGSCRGRRGFHLGARASGVGFEVLVKEAGKHFRRGVVCGLVGPTVARTQDLRGHAGALGDDVEAEDRIALRLRARERPAMDRVDDGARVLQADAFSDAVRTAAPSRIHEPDARVVLAHLLREELGVLARMPDEERPAEAR